MPTYERLLPNDVDTIGIELLQNIGRDRIDRRSVHAFEMVEDRRHAVSHMSFARSVVCREHFDIAPEMLEIAAGPNELRQ